MALAVVMEPNGTQHTNVQIKESFDTKYPLDKMYKVPNSLLALVL